MAGSAVFYAQQVGHLAEGHQESGPRHETDHHRFGDVPRQIAQLEHADQNLEDADHHCQQKDGLIHVEASFRIEERERAEND